MGSVLTFSVGFLLIVLCSAQNIIFFHIMEELPVGTLVGNVGVESGLHRNLTNDELSRVRYNFLDQTDLRSLFRIHETTGNILIKSLIDREDKCIFSPLCILSFDVALHSSNPNFFEIYTIEVTIEDRNDNSPTFSSDSTTINIPESALVGSTYGLDGATDSDSTFKNTMDSYQLLHYTDIFELQVKNNSDGQVTLKLVLQRKLDREEKANYQLELLAKDGGIPTRTGTMAVVINVDDENDNSPSFEQDTYAISINEGAVLQTPLIAVVAHDKDTGDNAKIGYRFNPRQVNIEVISKLFSIDADTGVMYVAGEIKYGRQNTYKISIEASDKGNQPRITYTTVIITILDTTNNKPTVGINFLISTNDSFVSLSEAAETGTVIAHVTVEDTDSGPNGQILCAISSEYVALQDISGKPGYLIVVTKKFDREVKQEHYISVTCSDNGVPKLSTTNSFILQILDENDNKPEFNQAVYSIVIDENSPEGQYLIKVIASDDDVWPNDNIYYSLVENPENKFSINHRTGVIRAIQRLDRESRDEYRFTVIATDRGSPALTGTTSVIVVVKDINDNKPTFDVPYFQFFIRENEPENAVIGVITAYDEDTGNNRLIDFSLVQSPGENLPFSVNSQGEVRAKVSFDREKDNSFIFEIVAKDRGLPPLSTKIFVRVYVTDENDNKPIIRYPNSFNSTVEVAFSAVTGTYLTRVMAVDKDENGPNSRLHFNIIEGNEENIFSISSTSGKIYLKENYQTKPIDRRTLTVSVSDNGKVPFTTNVTFTLVLRYTDAASALSTVRSESSGKKNIIITIAVVSMTLIISGALVAVIFVLRRSEQIRKKINEEHEKQKNGFINITKEPEVKVQNEIHLKENMNYQEPVAEKIKDVHSSYDEDLNNMELYTSFGTSVFTDTLPGLEKPGQSMDDHRIIKRLSLKYALSDEQISGIYCLDDISETSGEAASEHTDSGRGSSDPDLTRSTNYYYNNDRNDALKPRPTNSPYRFHNKEDYKSIKYEQKYYGFVDRPVPYNIGTNNYPSDLKIVRFTENGQQQIETSSFV